MERVPLLVVIDDGYFGHEALHDELGPEFEVRFAAGLLAVHVAMGELTCPLVVAPRTLDPLPGDRVLGELARHRFAFVGVLLLDQGADDGLDRAGAGVHMIVRRPLKPGHLRLHCQAAARIRAELIGAGNEAARLGADIARMRDGLRHDLRGYLQAVVGLASLMLELERPKRAADDELLDFLSRILGSGERMTHFVDLLGDWLNASRRPLELVPVDLGELLLEVVAKVHTTMPELKVTLDPPDPTALAVRVDADARLLQRALEVLVERACRVNPQVRLSLARVETGWRVTVSDVLARALPAAQRRKAFELFEKVAGGEGIELALVHKIAERHGATAVLEPLAVEGGHAAVLTWPQITPDTPASSAGQPSGPLVGG